VITETIGSISNDRFVQWVHRSDLDTSSTRYEFYDFGSRYPSSHLQATRSSTSRPLPTPGPPDAPHLNVIGRPTKNVDAKGGPYEVGGQDARC